MKYNEVTAKIEALSRDHTLSFPQRAVEIELALDKCSREEIIEHLDQAGVIPECFDHDSTEEKLFAKYCDALLTRSLRELGLQAEMITERADAADVLAKAEGHSLVGDAKAFRLSRTAKNQKDFKVESLNKWRKTAEYACLIAPLYQYPNSDSQIYSQAIRYNVALLSYAHLAFLIRNLPESKTVLEKLWKLGRTLKDSNDARKYWDAVDMVLGEIKPNSKTEWLKAKKESLERIPHQAKREIHFLEKQKAKIAKLSHDEAVKQLIEALRIDSKIEAIRKTAKI
jgi:HindIII restriction endonuclease